MYLAQANNVVVMVKKDKVRMEGGVANVLSFEHQSWCISLKSGIPSFPQRIVDHVHELAYAKKMGGRGLPCGIMLDARIKHRRLPLPPPDLPVRPSPWHRSFRSP